MRDLLRRSVVLSLLVLTALSGTGKFSSSSRTSARVTQDTLPRTAAGVYAKIFIDQAVSRYTGPPENIHSCLKQMYEDLLANPAISGLTIGEHWDKIQLTDSVYPDGYDFSYLDDAFQAAHDQGKKIRLIITPGFDTPKWLMDKLPECVFVNGKLQAPCGKQQFYKFPEEQRADSDMLPLPWDPTYKVAPGDPTYKSAWYDFLRGLNAKYSADTAFVSIAVAGPVAASDEMILPTSLNDKHIQPSGLSVDKTWEELITKSSPRGVDYAKSDQVFVDEWNYAIDQYEQIFHGLTIFLGPDGGRDFPEFKGGIIPPLDNTTWQGKDCYTTTTPISCGAKTAILTHFLAATGDNLRATQIGGLRASSQTTDGNIGLPGVKLLTSLKPSPTPPPVILGGAAFDHPVSEPNQTQFMGCPIAKKKGGCTTTFTVEEAAENVLAVFFDKTHFSDYYQGVQAKPVSKGNEPIHYLDVPYDDVQYAEMHPCPVTTSTTLGDKSLQDLLLDASHDLLSMPDGPTATRSNTCVRSTDNVPPVTTAALSGAIGSNGWFNGPTIINFTASDVGAGVAETEYSLDNGTSWAPITCGELYLGTDGIFDVLYRSTDLANNIEPPKSVRVLLDSTAPVTTATTHTVRGKTGPISVVVSLGASDNLSGVARTEYSFDNGSHWTTGTSIALNESGTYTILFRSIDVAGNVEKRNSIQLNVNVNPPTQR